MDRKDIEVNLAKLNSSYSINDGISLAEVSEAEKQLGLKLPNEIVSLYQNFNGFQVDKPMLELYTIKDLKNHNNLLEFAKFNGSEPVGFDYSQTNQADQWNIVSVNTNYVITFTIASFLTNKIWAWLHRNREIWAEEIYT